MTDRYFLLAAILALLVAAGCGERTSPRERTTMTILLTSAAFDDGQVIPKRHSGDGEDLSPPLAWTNVPAGAAELALIVSDPDASSGHWVHWVIYGIPAGTTELPEGLPRSQKLDSPPGAAQGRNSWPSDNVGYRGPQPPPGKPHRYVFVLYALDAATHLAPGASDRELRTAMEGHVLAEGELTGLYQR